MDEHLYEHETKVATELARQAGAILLEHYNSPFLVEQKINANDELEEVTAADREANELIVSRLQKEFPDDGILAEESTDTEHRLNKDRVWLIDPMDGTKNFINRDGDFAVQIGLAVGGESVLGVVYQPVRAVLYRAAHNRGAWIEAGRQHRHPFVGFEPVQRERDDPGIQPLASQPAHGARRQRVWFQK